MFQRCPFASQLPGALRIIPDAGFSQFQIYFGEAFLAQVKVKDTP
jgi:hypothetical protein